MERIDCAVIGVGVLGLVARLALAGREVVALESPDMIGSGTSSHNSQVIHARMFYGSGSLSARHLPFPWVGDFGSSSPIADVEHIQTHARKVYDHYKRCWANREGRKA